MKTNVRFYCLGLTSVLLTAALAAAETRKEIPVIEIFTLKARPKARSADLLSFIGKVGDALRLESGFVSAKFVAGQEGTYLAIVEWRSRADAEKAEKRESPADAEKARLSAALFDEKQSSLQRLDVVLQRPEAP
jgi:heme-degrading monooxygenase HmoA